MFLEQGTKLQNKFWKYLLGSLLIFVGLSIGQILISLIVFLTASVNLTKLPNTANGSLGALSPNIVLLLFLIVYTAALTAIYFVSRYLHNQTWQSLITSRTEIDWRRIFFSFGLCTTFSIVFYCFLIYFWPDEQVFIFKPLAFAIYFIIIICLSFLRAFTEQVVYCGYLMQGFANLSANRWFPMIMVAVISSLVYITHPEIGAKGYITMFFFQLIYALFFCVLTLMDEGIELAIGFYTATLLITQCFWTSDDTAIKTASLFMTLNHDHPETGIGLENIVERLIIIPIFLLICSKKYGWANWKQKLLGQIEVLPIVKAIEKYPDTIQSEH